MFVKVIPGARVRENRASVGVGVGVCIRPGPGSGARLAPLIACGEVRVGGLGSGRTDVECPSWVATTTRARTAGKMGRRIRNLVGSDLCVTVCRIDNDPPFGILRTVRVR